MKNTRVTKRYANALLGLALEKKVENQIYNDMVLIEKTCLENKDLTLLLKSPIIKSDQKNKILKRIFLKNISDMSMLFINIITNKKREYLLKNIAVSYNDLYKKHNKIKTASVTTAILLSEDLRKKVIEIINEVATNKIELNEFVDPKIIGGAIIRMGDKQLDASVSSAIKKLKNKFNKNLYIQDY